MRLPNWVGDAIMVLPALRVLARDGQRWWGVAHPRVLPIYRATGLFERLWPARGASAPLRLAAPLRRFRPDRALVFTEAPSGPLLALVSGAPRRLGRRAGRPGLLTHALSRAPRDRPAWRSYLALAEAAGATALGGRPDFSLEPGAEARARAGALLGFEEGTTIAVAPGAAYGEAKRWPIQRHQALVRSLVARGRRVIALGGLEERNLGQALAREGALDLTGRTGLLDVVAVLGRASLLVAHDSGALHLARAAGTPVVALFGSTSPAWTGPEPDEGEVIRVDVPCSPCFRRRCPLEKEEHLRCLRGIETPVVLEAVERRLAGGQGMNA
jgi:heptosyltransferase-2